MGPDLRDCKQVRVAAGIDIYFCDPHGAWQHATKRKHHGLLRQNSRTALTCHSTAQWTSTGSPPNSTTDRPNA
jgi:IS30 family transposase